MLVEIFALSPERGVSACLIGDNFNWGNCDACVSLNSYDLWVIVKGFACEFDVDFI